MRKSIIFFAILSVLPLLFMGCGTYCGDTPMGSTGGEGGHGILSLGNTMTGHDGGGDEIYGAWRHDYGPGEYDLLYIQQGGNFSLYEYYDYSLDDYVYGTYSYTSTEITINIQGQGTEVCDYEYTGSSLTIHYNSGTITYYRVSLP